MKKNKRKLIAYILASNMFLSGCQKESIDIKNIIDIIKEDIERRTSSMQEEVPIPSETEAIIDVIQTTDNTIFEIIEPTETEVIETTVVTEPLITEVIEQTEPIIIETTEPTEYVVVETEPNIEETIPVTEPIVEETLIPTEPQIEEEDIIEKIPNDIVVYANTEVNIRSSNTTSSLRIGSLQINESAVRLLSCENGWDLIKQNDLIGYVNSSYLYYSDEIVETEYKHMPKNDIVLTKSELNFRVAPSTNSKQILRFPQNTELQVVAEVDNGWLLVRVDGVLGYVHGDYTESLFDKAREQYPDFYLNDLSVKKIVYCSASDLNIRNGNGTNFDRLGSLSTYESVRVLGEYDNWYFIMTNNYEFGFVNKDYTKELNDLFVIVDLSEQKLYLYNNNVLCYDTPVTTGKDSTPSDIGLFRIYNKETDKYLIGIDEKTGAEEYRSFVNYWMPYNGGEGLHDATWRGVFGTPYYTTNGSHGCINMPLAITDEIYNTVSIGTKVLVHK